MELKLLICLFLVRNILCADSLENSEEHEEDIDFKRLENEFATGNVPTDNVTSVPENKESLVASDDLVTSEKPSNETKEFRPSILLGEIEESRSAKPFNSLQHINFVNFVNPDSSYENGLPEKKNKFKQHESNDEFDTERLKVQNGLPSTHFWNQYSNFVSFPDPTTTFHDSTVIFEKPAFPSVIEENPYLSYGPISNYKLAPYFGEPTKFQIENEFVTSYPDVQSYESLTLPNFGTIRKPEVIGLPLLQETSLIKNQRFPYKFHQEPADNQDTTFEFVGEHEVMTSPKEKRISQWKKIVHLIGTLLPLGLLLAALSPNVVQIKNTTQPNIVLSKLREIELPTKHTQRRIDGQPTICEERSICKMILEGSKPTSNLLQNIMWNSITRMTEETIKKNDLREVFNAVVKKDCNLINC